jgi:hypothetical protein
MNMAVADRDAAGLLESGGRRWVRRVRDAPTAPEHVQPSRQTTWLAVRVPVETRRCPSRGLPAVLRYPEP